MHVLVPPLRRSGWIAILLALTLSALPLTAGAAAAERLLHILDYIGVDYPGTVSNGQIVHESEYREQVEFAGRLEQMVNDLPAKTGREDLLTAVQSLTQSIAAKAPGPEVQRQTQDLRARVVDLYGVATAPRRAPDVARAQALFAQNCASCHGAEGRGDGPIAANLEPKPTNFHDRARAGERSPYGLYSAISLGVDGTAMRGFDELDDEQRWALAFYVSSLAFTAEQRQQGEQLVAQDRVEDLRGLGTLASLTPNGARARFGDEGVAVLAYLRRHPDQATASGQTPIRIAQARLAESLAAYRAGDGKQAYEAAVSAYLDGFELAESGLKNVAPALLVEIEQHMLAYREQVRAGAPIAEVEAKESALQALLQRADETLNAGRLTAGMGFASALVILLREGLEAILILAAVGGVLIRTGRRDALRYLHAGWIAALALGAVTWTVSSYLIAISGAGREFTEGFTALLAAVVLLYVGLWLHGKTHARRWQEFVQERIQRALHGRALWVLAGISFLAVYREVFETVLFYQALWLQIEPGAQASLWTGIAAAAVLLVLLGWVIVRSSLHLPLRLFFSVNAVIMLLLAVAFAGHGVAALQGAGMLPVDPVNFPRLDLLGIYPTTETLAAQLLLVLVVAATLWAVRRRERAQAAATH